jgi:hypothetical protein
MSKTILRCTGGFQFMFSTHLGLRVLATWENTAQFHIKGKRLNAINANRSISSLAKASNTLRYGVGIFFDFLGIFLI